MYEYLFILPNKCLRKNSKYDKIRFEHMFVRRDIYEY